MPSLLPTPIQMILIEDDEVDAEVIDRACRAIGAPIQITRFRDGREAIDALRGPFGRNAVTNPYLILLDLNLPRMGGIAFLDELRADPSLRRSIVFALTASEADEDKLAAYDRRVAGYLVKGTLGQDYTALTSLLSVYEKAIEFPRL